MGKLALSRQVEPPRKRRYMTLEFKFRILREIDACRGENGAIGALLRREGLYASSVAQWRKLRESGQLSALGKKRGRPVVKNTEQLEIEKLQKENARLTRKLEQSEKIIEIQKKVAALLGNPIDD